MQKPFDVQQTWTIKSLLQSFNKISLCMKLSVLFLFCSLGLVQAAESYAQKTKISIEVTGQTVGSVLEIIENQTDFDFFFNNKHVDLNRVVSVSIDNKNVFDVLDQIFAGTDVSYSVLDKKIILSTKAKSSQSDVTVRGKIVSINGDPIIGATILESGTNNGTVSDIDGNFSLTVKSKESFLEISYIGYKEQRVKVLVDETIYITLLEDTEALDEVVVVGFGTQKKANLTGAVSTVKMDDVLGNRPLTNTSSALQGAIPGLMVSNTNNSPGASKSFQIRGVLSINGGNPLVLIDNVEGDIDMINPNDIESISVMKDAASSAIYGARAAGGVILITTKRPKDEAKFKLDYNNNFAFTNAINLPKQSSLMNYLQAYYDACGDQFWTPGNTSVLRWMELLKQYNANPSSLEIMGDGIYKDTDGSIYYLNEKDLAKNMLEGGFQMTHNVSVSGATDKLRYRLSAGYVDQDGVLITDKDQYNRKNFSGFISADITPWLTQEANFSYAHSKSNLPTSPLGSIYTTDLTSYYPEGTCPEGGDYGLGGVGLPFFTPKNEILAANSNKKVYDNPRLFLKSILKPFKGMEVVFEYTFDKNINDYHYYTGKWEYTTIQGGVNVTPSEDYLYKYKNATDYNAFNLYGTYQFNLKDHNIKVMAGFNQESKYFEQLDAYSYSQAIMDFPSMAGGTSTIKALDEYNEVNLRGGFFRVNYNYKDRYLLELNGRYDGSSKFPKKNRFGFFPSASIGWQIAEEKFMQSTRDWLGSLKLRASYGEIGNQNISSYMYTPTLSISNSYKGWLNNGEFTTAIIDLPAMVSNSFTWEVVKTFNIGLDFSMFNNRLTGVLEYFQRDTEGMLAPGMELPGVVGASAPYQNTADMRTKGWEINLNWRDWIGRVGYRIGLNLSDSKSKISNYDSNESKLLTTYYEGQELGEIWGYVVDDFYTANDFESTDSWILKEGVTTIDGISPRPGDLKFKNLMDEEGKNNIITSGNNTLENPGDRKIIGNTTPRYLFGLNLGANYAGFDLNVFIQGTGQRDCWLANNLVFPLYPNFKFTPLYEGLENYWKPVDMAAGNYTNANPNAEYPRIYGNYGNQSSNFRISDKYLSDASYLRIKNVTLSYTFPKMWVEKISLQNLKAFVSVENLATFSSLPKGIDPETLSWSYPAFRTVSLGFNLSL